MPSVVTVLRWLRENEAFRTLYTRAKEESADTLADEIIDLSDTELPLDEHGHVDNGAVQQLRLRVEARKWVAAKLKPRKYGDRVTQEHSGPGGAPIQVVTGVPGAAQPAAIEAQPTPMLLDVPPLTIDAPTDND